ncbi:MAG: winged helix-turn-helix transcriptional regulator [Chitinophagia bacterium]|nr:winged helix-turn-helix transcriptional regulator [Chitinophagia bacterium]
MTIEQLTNLLKTKLLPKQIWVFNTIEPETLLKHSAALLNATGGIIIIHLKAKKTPPQKLDDLTYEIGQTFLHKLSPLPPFYIKPFAIDTGTAVVIQFPVGYNKPYLYNRSIYLCNDDGKVFKATHHEIAYFMNQKAHADLAWGNLINDDYKFYELDIDLVLNTIRNAEKNNLIPGRYLSIGDYLINMGLVAEKVKVTNNCVLLFNGMIVDEDTEALFTIEANIFAGIAGLPTKTAVYYGGLLKNVEQLIEFLTYNSYLVGADVDSLGTASSKTGNLSTQVLLNAIVYVSLHLDYSVGKTSLVIDCYKDRIEFRYIGYPLTEIESYIPLNRHNFCPHNTQIAEIINQYLYEFLPHIHIKGGAEYDVVQFVFLSESGSVLTYKIGNIWNITASKNDVEEAGKVSIKNDVEGKLQHQNLAEKNDVEEAGKASIKNDVEGKLQHQNLEGKNDVEEGVKVSLKIDVEAQQQHQNLEDKNDVEEARKVSIKNDVEGDLQHQNLEEKNDIEEGVKVSLKIDVEGDLQHQNFEEKNDVEETEKKSIIIKKSAKKTGKKNTSNGRKNDVVKAKKSGQKNDVEGIKEGKKSDVGKRIKNDVEGKKKQRIKPITEKVKVKPTKPPRPKNDVVNTAKNDVEDSIKNDVEGLRGDDKISQFVYESSLGEQSKNVKDGIVKVLDYLLHNPGATTSIITDTLGKSKPTVHRYLTILKDKNIIDYKGTPKNGAYYLKPKYIKQFK